MPAKYLLIIKNKAYIDVYIKNSKKKALDPKISLDQLQSFLYKDWLLLELFYLLQ